MSTHTTQNLTSRLPPLLATLAGARARARAGERAVRVQGVQQTARHDITAVFATLVCHKYLHEALFTTITSLAGVNMLHDMHTTTLAPPLAGMNFLKTMLFVFGVFSVARGTPANPTKANGDSSVGVRKAGSAYQSKRLKSTSCGYDGGVVRKACRGGW